MNEKWTASGLARYSEEFFRAARAVDKDMGRDEGYEIIAPVPVQFLVAHSIELILKAYLQYRGSSKKQLQNLGHDLLTCFEEAVNVGLNYTMDDGQLEALKALSHLHSTTQLRYIKPGMFPIMGPISKIAKDLQDVVCPVVGYEQKLQMFIG